MAARFLCRWPRRSSRIASASSATSSALIGWFFTSGRCLPGPEVRSSAFDVFPEGIGQLGAMLVEHASGCALHFFDEAVEVVAGAGDGNNADGGRLPGDPLVHFGHRDVEALLQLVLEGAHDLPPVFERPGMLDADFKSQLRDWHSLTGIYRDSVSPFA